MKSAANHGNFARIGRKVTASGAGISAKFIFILCDFNALKDLSQFYAEFRKSRDPIPFTPLSKEKKNTSKA